MTATLDRSSDLRVSVVIPTYNRRDRLERLLRTLAGMPTAEHLEILVVVDGSSDGTDEMLAALELPVALRIFWQANRGPAAARNVATRAATGDVLLFLDDDVLPVTDLVERHLAVHRADEHAVVMGPMLAPPGVRLAPWLAWEAATLEKQYEAMAAGRFAPTPRQFYTANASVRRECALDAGGFDERFTRAEDVEFAARLADRGMRFYFLPEASVLHEPHRSLAAWLQVPFDYGRFAVVMAREQGRSDVQTAYREWRERHPLNRVLPRWCIGHPSRLKALLAAGAAAIRYTGPGASHRWQRLVCSAVYNVQYWQGVATESGLGGGVWRGLTAPPPAGMAMPAPGAAGAGGAG
jgi:GT2 family glycosyltransferase